MSVQDLGELDGPVLVFGGAHGNLEATAQVLAAAAHHAIPPGHLICTGDTAAYCADPGGVAMLLRAAGVHVVMGNCEEALGADSLDCGCTFPAGGTCDRLSAHWFEYCRNAISPETKAWMGHLPRRIEFTLGGTRLVAIHGSPRAIAEHVFASTPSAVKAPHIEEAGADGIVAGHSGLLFSQIIEGRLWHNVGAIGIPANDGTPRVWYSILRPFEDAPGIRIEPYALDYDFRTAQSKMHAATLPEEYAQALSSGFWDNCEVLPESETLQTDRALSPAAVMWRPRAAAAAQ